MNTKNLIYAFMCMFAVSVMCSCSSTPGNFGLYSDDLRYLPVEKDDYYTFVDIKTGEEKGHYDEILSMYRDGYAMIQEDDSIYFVNHDQEKCFGPYASATSFSEGIAWVAPKGKGLMAINKKGETLFDLPRAEMACAFREGLSVFMDSEKREFGVVDKEGNVVISPKYQFCIGMYVDGLLGVAEEYGKYGFIDKEGNVVIPFQYDDIIGNGGMYNTNLWRGLKEGRIPVKKGDQWGIVDREGKYVITPQFDYILLDGENYLFRKDREYGWCDRDGKYIIEPQYEEASPFGNGPLASVGLEIENEDMIGYINIDGDTVFTLPYDDEVSSPFWTNGLAITQMDGEYGLINEQGKWEVNPQYREIALYGDMYLVKDGEGDWGLIGKDGKYLVNPAYDRVIRDVYYNNSGLLYAMAAESDYFDMSSVVEDFETAISKAKTWSVAEVCEFFSLLDSDFSRYRTNTQLYYESGDNSSVEMKAVYGSDIWTQKSNGWWYDYILNKDAKINQYLVILSLKNKAIDHLQSIEDAIEEKLRSNPEISDFSIQHDNSSITINLTTK